MDAIPPKPEGGQAEEGAEKKQETPKPRLQPSKEEPTEIEVESEESDAGAGHKRSLGPRTP